THTAPTAGMGGTTGTTEDMNEERRLQRLGVETSAIVASTPQASYPIVHSTTSAITNEKWELARDVPIAFPRAGAFFCRYTDMISSTGRRRHATEVNLWSHALRIFLHSPITKVTKDNSPCSPRWALPPRCASDCSRCALGITAPMRIAG